MSAGIIAFFAALPQILTMISQLGLLMQRLIAVAKQNNLDSWTNNLEAEITKLEKAKTQEDKLASAASLAAIFKSLGN